MKIEIELDDALTDGIELLGADLQSFIQEAIEIRLQTVSPKCVNDGVACKCCLGLKSNECVNEEWKTI